MAFRIKHGNDEITVDTEDEFRAVMKVMKEGEGAAAAPIVAHDVTRQAPSVGASDRALLTALVNAGASGIEAGRVGEMLGTRGRGVPFAIQRWAARVKLIPDGSPATVVESSRIGTKRGYRLSGGMLDAGRNILGRQ